MNIRKIARDFARRTVAEYELMEEGMPVLIGNDGQEPVHTDNHPYCSDPTCPCHYDMERYEQYIGQPKRDGLLTTFEGYVLRWGENI